MYARRFLITIVFAMACVVQLVLPVLAIPGQQDFSACPWGYPAYDTATRSFVSQCSSGYAADAPAVAATAKLDVLYDCPWGYPSYDATTHTYFSQCSSGYVAPWQAVSISPDNGPFP